MKKYFLSAFVFLNLSNSFAQQPFCSYAKKQVGEDAIASPTDVSRMNNYDVYFYKLNVDVENNSVYIQGIVEIHAKAVNNFSEFVFELHDSLSIDSVVINDSKKTFSRSNGIVTVSVNGVIAANATVKTVIYYKGFCPQGASAAIGNGFSNSASRKVTWSLSESYAACEWWPCKQVLYDKADSAEIWITTDSANKAGSNGLLINTVNLLNGKKRYEWKTHYPIDYYLISVAVSKYEEYNLYAHPAGADSVLIQNYIYDPSVKPALNNTPALIEMYSQVFGLYPFALEKYGHCMAPVNGGMEHQTMTTLGPTSAFTFNVITHELAHQWFGDLVTCGSWADIWLNEGFASYSEYISNERLATGSATSWMSSTMAGAKNAWGWVYVHDTLDTPTLFNSAATYNKGAVILHMLRYEINNDSIFYLGIRNYLNAFKFSTAVSTDFQSVMEQTSGKNLGYFFDEWLRGRGYPAFSAKWNQVGNKLFVNLTQVQATPYTETPLFKTTIDVRIVFSNGDSVIRVWVDSLSKIYSFNVAGRTVNTIQVDAKDWILNDIGTIVKDNTFNAVADVNETGNEIIMYPNPSSDKLNLINANGCLVEVFDISGKLKISRKISDVNSLMEMSELANGFYLIRIEKNGAVRNMKFVKE